MAKETSKATERRLEEEYPWSDVFTGLVLDVGPGDDLLQWMRCTVMPFDKEQGDANRIDTYFADDTFDCVHGSQVLEHLHDPVDALKRFLKITKPGGWVVMTVPSELYEGNILPSRYNPDHKATFSAISQVAPWQRNASLLRQYKHIWLPDLAKLLAPHQVSVRLIDTNYDYMVGTTRDQSWLREDGVEMWWEITIHKNCWVETPPFIGIGVLY